MSYKYKIVCWDHPDLLLRNWFWATQPVDHNPYFVESQMTLRSYRKRKLWIEHGGIFVYYYGSNKPPVLVIPEEDYAAFKLNYSGHK